MSCQDLTETGNEVTSMRVYKNTVLGPAVGYWIPLQTHEGSSISFTQTIGFDYSHSELTSETQEETLSYSMTMGMSFNLLGAESSMEQTIAHEYTETI